MEESKLFAAAEIEWNHYCLRNLDNILFQSLNIIAAIHLQSYYFEKELGFITPLNGPLLM